MPLNRSLNVPWGCPRWVISGPKRKRLPAPTFASAMATPPLRRCCPQAHPLRKGASESNQATGLTPVATAAGNSRITGLLSKKTSTSSSRPQAIGRELSTRTRSTVPGT